MNRIEFYSNLAKFQGRNGDAFLKHYGIIGQKWGTRRWQNADGTFNTEGKERYFGSKGNKEKNVDEKADKSFKNKWPMNDLFKKAGYDYNDSDDETRELFEMEVNDIRNSYKNGNDINKLSKEFGYDKNFIQDVIDSDTDEKIGSDWNKENHMQNFNNWNKIGKKIGIDGSNIRSILESNEDFYNDEAKNIILKNAKLISKMNKALEKNDSDKYMKLRNSEFENDMEKDICEEFIKDKRILDDFNNTINNANKDFKKKGIDIKVNDYNDYYDKKSHEFKEVYPSDFIKDNNKMNKYKNTINTVKKDYDKINEEMIDKLGDIYYEAFKNTFGYEEHPLTKSEFKKTFGKFDGELKPTPDGNGMIEGSIESKEYGDYGTYYFFEYDLANKIFNYIDEE